MLQSWSCAEQLPISASCAAQQSPEVLNPLPSAAARRRGRRAGTASPGRSADSDSDSDSSDQQRPGPGSGSITDPGVVRHRIASRPASPVDAKVQMRSVDRFTTVLEKIKGELYLNI